MSEPRAVAEQLYQAFAIRDGQGMAALYTDDATFSDPVFTGLKGSEVGDMWRMLTSSSSDLEVTLDELFHEADVCVARWTARYTFSKTGRKVTNRVTSTIRVEGDKIAAQVDDFDFLLWQAQALGGFGKALGWTGIPGLMIRRAAKKGLVAYRAKQRRA